MIYQTNAASDELRYYESIVSKAADRSSSRRAVECPASSEARMSFWTYNRAVSEE